MLTRVLEPAARRFGLASAGLLGDWPTIVGTALAERCQPIRLSKVQGGGVLHLRVGGPAALELQHSAPQIIERINQYFGFPAVARLSLSQQPLPLPERRIEPAQREPTADEVAHLGRALSAIDDPALREALLALGLSVLSRPPRPDPR